MKKKMTYVPNVFAHKVTQEDLEKRPELAMQGLEVGSIEVFREISDEDITEFSLPEKMKGEWAMNGAFDIEEFPEDVDAKLELLIKSDGLNVELNITSAGDEMAKPFILLGAIDVAKQELLDSFTKTPADQSSDVDMVDYTFTQLDIDTMGEMNPGHKVGDTIKMPRQAVEMLIQSNELSQELGCEDDCPCEE